jgi:hypothetical protein
VLQAVGVESVERLVVGDPAEPRVDVDVDGLRVARAMGRSPGVAGD